VWSEEKVARAMNGRDRVSRYGWLAGACAVLSVLACYGTLGVITVLSLLGISLTLNPRAWAAAIVALAAASALLVAANFTRHRKIGPLALAVAGVSLVGWVMYAYYIRSGELVGFALMLVAAAWDFRLRRCAVGPRRNSGGPAC